MSLSRAWRRAVLAGAIVSPFLAGCPGPTPKPVKHVVLLVIDTQRFDRLGAYGCQRALTPAIDELARESVVFERCASQASWTSPSMVSMMTGCYVAEELMTIPAEKPTLAECFRDAGWSTGGFVCNDILNPDTGFARGFQTFEGELKPYEPNTPILEWLRAHKDERTFTWIHLNEVHDELVEGEHCYRPQPESEWRKYRDVREGFSAGRQSYYDELTRSLGLVEREASLARMQEEAGSYDDDVRCEDRRVGEILRELRQLGIWDQTLLVLGADHGEGLFTREQYLWGTRKAALERGEKPTLFNTLQMTHAMQVNTELVHVPLIVHAPGVPAERVAGWVENIDIAPTLLELAGVPRNGAHQGQSLVPLLLDPRDEAALREAVFSHSLWNDSAIAQDSLQLILASPAGMCDFELQTRVYDLGRDPEARDNLVGRQPERERALAALITRRLKEGLGGSVGPISPATLKAMKGLGYVHVGSGVALAETLRGLSNAQLLDLAANSPGECMTRREIAQVLLERTLTSEERARVEAWAAKESSPAVSGPLARILARK